MKRDPGFQEALAKRGVTDFEAVQVDAWPAGNFGAPEEQDRRLARCLAFVRPRPGDSEWAHPVDGLIVLVDLTTLEVLRIDDHGVVPIPEESGNFDVEAATAGGRRCATTSARSRSASRRDRASNSTGGCCGGRTGSSTSASRRARDWSCNQVAYRDQGRRRPILFRASLSEMVVPYGDPSPTHFFKNAFDAGENGVGIARIAADPRLRLPGRDPLPRRRGRQRRRRAGRDPERDLHPRGGHRGAVAPHRVAKRRGRGPPRPPAGGLLVLGDRQLRLRLLLVPAPGRLDRLRGEAHRGALDRCRAARRASPATASSSRRA